VAFVSNPALGAGFCRAHVPNRAENLAAPLAGILGLFRAFVEFVLVPDAPRGIVLAVVVYQVPHIGEAHTAPFAKGLTQDNPPCWLRNLSLVDW
jgi:hypothetical protein